MNIDISALQAPVAIPDLTEVKANQNEIISSLSALAYVPGSALSIATKDQQAQALLLRKSIRDNLKVVEAKFKPIKQSMDASKKLVLAWEKETAEPLEAMDRAITTGNDIFIREQERIAREKAAEEARQRQIEAQRLADEENERRRKEWEKQEAERKAEAERLAAEKAERDRIALEEAAALEANGDDEGASAVIEEAITAPEPPPAPEPAPEPVFVAPEPVREVYVAPQVATVRGVVQRKVYSCKVTDMKALIEHCLANPALIPMYLAPNETQLNLQARTLKDKFSIPGCELIERNV